VEKLIDIQSGPVASLLDLLLKDKSTKKNIIWATDTYEELGHGFTDKEPISRSLLLQHADIIKPRIQKSQEAQQERTRKKAEVFTPAWLCNLMNNYCDEEWFGRKNVFNAENDDHTWTVVEGPIEFPKRKTWKHYVDSRRLEITCGEAPYLVSRYDVSTGQLIVPPERRIGQLDRKLRIVNENAADYNEWVKWAIRAFEASYGYEYQGDNLLIARINLLLTFIDYYQERWDKNPDGKLLQTVANKIAWNVWQMDGLKDTVPLGKPYEEFQQMTLFDISSEMTDEGPEAIPSKIYDWRRDNSIRFNKLKERKTMGHKLFNFVIGNPPYNEDFENSGDNGNFAKPVYNQFMDATYEIADIVELIHPARFLFNAGSTPKAWNEKMLNDKHFKVLQYEPNSTAVFPNTDIKGGVAITYHDNFKTFESIGIFTAFPELNEIVKKARAVNENKSIASMIYTQVKFDLDALYADYPEYKSILGSKGKDRRFRNNIFEKVALFTDEKKDEDDLRILGILKNKRTWKYISRKYVDMSHENLKLWKVLVPRANGSGALGEVLSTPLIGEPLIGYTQSFIGIGSFHTELEANALLQYVKSKFARVLLGVLKVTQDNDSGVWKLIPLQDYTSNSDIDWSKSIHEIDLQLYRKYGLDEKEIAFIESHVKEMA
jgi:type II restriction enzyme